jgi:hypothetical protein
MARDGCAVDAYGVVIATPGATAAPAAALGAGAEALAMVEAFEVRVEDEESVIIRNSARMRMVGLMNMGNISTCTKASPAAAVWRGTAVTTPPEDVAVDGPIGIIDPSKLMLCDARIAFRASIWFSNCRFFCADFSSRSSSVRQRLCSAEARSSSC